MRCPRFLIAAFCVASFTLCGAQPNSGNNTFTLSVSAPIKASDVQVRYVLTGDNVAFGHSVATPTESNQVVIQTLVDGKQARGLKLIAFAQGCQFVTISIDDFASSGRQGAFECAPLSTVQFHGRANLAALSGKALDVEAHYSCDWASQFFGRKISLSPFSLGRAEMASDGSFALELPDFSADPLWPALSNNARLTFLAIDANSGKPLLPLQAEGQSKEGSVKVAEQYPEVEFSPQSPVLGRAGR